MLATLLILLSSAAFLGVCALGLYGATFTRDLDREPPAPDPPRWPRLSVIVAALNEESTLEAALTTLLAEPYPELEVVVVNDRSTDGTGAIIDRLAAQDPRVRAVHVKELPPGWLGKLHALHRGAALASGEFLLFTDADVHFTPGVLARTVALAEAEGLDHFALMPEMIASSFALTATLVAFGVSFNVMVRPHRVGRPGSKAFVGVGAFNLVRRSTFERTPGFEWLKMEVGDDVGLGQMIVEHGGKPGWRMGGSLLKIEWYESVTALVRGLEKNTYGIFSHYRPSIFAAKLLVIAALWAGPLLALFAPPDPWLRGLGLVVIGGITALHVYTARQLRYSYWAGLAAPWIGSAVLLVALWRSALACWRDGGIRWRGTLYSVEDLRAGQRVKL